MEWSQDEFVELKRQQTAAEKWFSMLFHCPCLKVLCLPRRTFGGGGVGVWFEYVSGVIGSGRRAKTLIGWCDIAPSSLACELAPPSLKK
jgi:hypothetical protein